MNSLTVDVNSLSLNSHNVNDQSPRAEDGWFECLLCFKSKGLFDINKVCEECVDTQVFETSVWASVNTVDLTAFECYHTVKCSFCGDKLYALEQDSSTTQDPVCHSCVHSLIEVLDAHHGEYHRLVGRSENEEEEFRHYHAIMNIRRNAINKGGLYMQKFLTKKYTLRMTPETVPCLRLKRKKNYEEEKDKVHYEWNHRKQRMEIVSLDDYLINCI